MNSIELFNLELLNIELFNAVKLNDLELVKQLIKQGANINIKDISNNSILHIAAIKKNIEMVKYLIFAGAEIEILNNTKFPPLYYLMNNTIVYPLDENIFELDKVIKQIIKSTKKLNPKNWDILIYLIEKNDLDLIKYLISNGTQLTNIPTKFIKNRFIVSINKGYLEIADYLLKNGADINVNDVLNGTCLHSFIDCNNINAIKYLIDKGACLDIIDQYWNITPLVHAINRNNLKILKYLIANGADINKHKRDNGITLLNHAIGLGNLTITKYLISIGLDLNENTNDNKSNLHIASENGHHELIEYLIKQKNNQKIN